MILQDLRSHFHFRYIPPSDSNAASELIHQGFDVTACRHGLALLRSRGRGLYPVRQWPVLIVDLPTSPTWTRDGEALTLQRLSDLEDVGVTISRRPRGLLGQRSSCTRSQPAW